MTKFDPPKPQALTPGELVQAIAKFGADASGVANAVELIQIQDQLKVQDEYDLSQWAKQLVEDGSPKALAALENAGFNADGAFRGADLGSAEMAAAMPATEQRVDNRQVILATGLEGQFERQSAAGAAVTHKGSPLGSSAAALETATADRVSYFRPQARFADELGPLTTLTSVTALFGLSLNGLDGQIGHLLGFASGLLVALSLTLTAKLFPGIFALTSFGVNGARLLRGVLTGVISLGLLALVAVEARPVLLAIEGAAIPTYELLAAGFLIIATSLGLLLSGPKTLWLRATLAVLAPATIILYGFVMTAGFRLPELAFESNNFWLGMALGLLLKGSVDFSSTSGGWRYQWLSVGIGLLVFATTLHLVTVPNSSMWLFFLTLATFAVICNFASAASSVSRFWSVLGGLTIGVGSTTALLASGVAVSDLVVYAAATTGAWLASIAFDAKVRNGKLHLASLNRSFGFYGPFNWLSVLVLFSSGLIAGSLSLFSPLSEVIPPIASAPLLGIGFAVIFMLVRIPQIKNQEDEIMLALSRSSAANQVGIS